VEYGGYKLVASKFIPKGTCFLIETPIACLWSDIDNRTGCADCWHPLDRPGGKRVSCKACGEVYCCETCCNNARDSYHEVLCGQEWKNFLRSRRLDEISTNLTSSICLAIKITAMAVQQNIHPATLARLRHLSRLSDTRQASEGSVGRVIRLSEEDIGHRVESITRDMVHLCPTLIKKGVGHAGHVMEVVEAVSRNAYGKGEVGALHHTGLYFMSSFVNHKCRGGNAGYYIQPKKTGNLISFKSQRDIQKGENILTSFIEEMDYEQRRFLLKMNYGFECACRVCVMEGKKQSK